MDSETAHLTDRSEGHADKPKPIVQMAPEEPPRRSTPSNPMATEWAHAVPVLRSCEKMLLLVLARRSDAHGCSWCSQKTLARESGCCDRTVRNLLKNFEHRGIVRRVGRLGQHGAQLTDVVIIIGWPERKLIPEKGHPKLGLVLRETRETRLRSASNYAQARAQIPAGSEPAPDQNKVYLNNTTTAQVEETLNACFETLGPWATTENMQGLSDDLETLKGWIDKGIDLHLHILPVLAEKSKSQGKIPLLRTWRYFEVPISKAMNKRRQKTKAPRDKAADREKALQQPDVRRQLMTPTTRPISFQRQHAHDPAQTAGEREQRPQPQEALNEKKGRQICPETAAKLSAFVRRMPEVKA